MNILLQHILLEKVLNYFPADRDKLSNMAKEMQKILAIQKSKFFQISEKIARGYYRYREDVLLTLEKNFMLF